MKVVTIGRSSHDNDVIINDALVSRNHVQIIRDDFGNYKIIDLGSTNGTFVNGQRIHGEVALQPNDEVRIGSTVLPWPNYFANEPVSPQVAAVPTAAPAGAQSNRVWIFVAAGLALLLLVGGGLFWKFYYHDRQAQNPTAEQTASSQAGQTELEERALTAEANAEYNESMLEDAENQINSLNSQLRRLQQQQQQQQQQASAATSSSQTTGGDTPSSEGGIPSGGDETQSAIAGSQPAGNESQTSEGGSQTTGGETPSRGEGQSSDGNSQGKPQGSNIVVENRRPQGGNNEGQSQVERDFNRLLPQIRDRRSVFETDYLKMICNGCGIEIPSRIRNAQNDQELTRDLIRQQFQDADANGKRRILEAVRHAYALQGGDSESSTNGQEGVGPTQGGRPANPGDNGGKPNTTIDDDDDDDDETRVNV